MQWMDLDGSWTQYHDLNFDGWNICMWWTKNMNVTYYINLHKWNNQNIKHPTKQNQTPTKINLAPTTLGVELKKSTKHGTNH
jgi:hypothetical protein